MYHIIDPGRFGQALDNIAKSMKDGGLFLFTDRFGASSDVRVAEHVQFRCLSTYEQHLAAKGFELVGLHPLYRYLNTINFNRLDNYLGWLYFALDNMSTKIVDDNLSLSVWRFRKERAVLPAAGARVH